MKKKIVLSVVIICSLIFVLGIINVSATEYYGAWQYYVNDGEATISDYYGSATFLVIPETINGYPVTGISAYAFYLGDYTFKSVIIPDSVKTIGDYAFYTCNNMTSVVIGDGVEKIGYLSFSSCGITEVTLGESVTYIDKNAFSGCTNLTTVTISNSVTYMGNHAFSGCGNLETIYYNGTEDEYNSIKGINQDNDNLKEINKVFFTYVTIFDKDGNKISKKMQNVGEVVDVSGISVSDEYYVQLYTDKDMTKAYNRNTVITENLMLYVDFLKINHVGVAGPHTVDIGETDIIHEVSLATDKEFQYFVCTVKFSHDLDLIQICEKEFTVTEDFREIIDGYTYVYLTCKYKGDNKLTINTKLVPFELVFNVSENATVDDVLTVEILKDATAITENESYTFKSFESNSLRVNPILAEVITINGEEVIDKIATYTVSFLPENTTNKEVQWTVSDESVAIVSQDGVLTPLKKGIVTLKAVAKDGSNAFALKTITVKLYAAVSDISSNIGVWEKSFLSSENNYIIYVPKASTSIKLTAMHDGTLESIDGTKEFINNVPKVIALAEDITVLGLNYVCDGYEPRAYTITVIKFEGTKTELSENKKTFTVNPINIENGKTVILALYEEEKFVEMQSATYEGEAISFPTDKTYTNAKVMVWDSLSNLKPIYEVEMVK